jgi:ABC-2 type transport system permease protein
MFVNIQAIARKEFYHLIRDYRSLYLAFALPLLMILLFGYALSLDVDNVEVVVVDHDKTDGSRDFLTKLNSTSYLNVIGYPADDKTAAEFLDHGTATVAVIIPPGWSAKIKADREAPLQVLIDGSDPNFAGITRGFIMAIVGSYNQELLVNFLNRNGINKIDPPVEGRIRVWFNEDLESRHFIVPGIIAVIIMIVGAMLTSLVIAREYESGTMETILSIPVHAGEFLIGKAIPYFFITFIDIFVAIFMGQILFGVVMKSSFWLMMLGASLYLFVALSLGLFISIVTKSQLVANQVAILTTYLPSLMLSDFVFPRANMPEVLQVLTYIIPATYFIDILNGLYLRNIGLNYLWPSYLVLVLMTTALSIATYLRLKKEGM